MNCAHCGTATELFDEAGDACCQACYERQTQIAANTQAAVQKKTKSFWFGVAGALVELVAVVASVYVATALLVVEGVFGREPTTAALVLTVLFYTGPLHLLGLGLLLYRRRVR